MPASETLHTIAELSVALAGFSGVVLGIQGVREGGLERQDTFGIAHILTSSGAAMLFSLLPEALRAAGLAESTAWSATSLILGVFVLVASVGWGVAARTTAPRFPVVFYGFIASGVLLGSALVITTTGLVDLAGSLLPLVLVWLLLVGFVQFSTFLALIWSRPGSAS